MRNDQQLLADRQRLLGAGYRLFYQHPLHPVRGEGVWLYDASGKAYLDAYNNVVSVGHCHPRVVEAISRQAATLNTHTRYLHDTILDYADALLRHFPAPLSQLTMTCSGSEANDLALRIARFVTSNQVVIVTRNAYHGVTSAVANASPSLGGACGPEIRVIDAPDPRLPPGSWLTDLRRVIQEINRQGLRPAALLMDTIFASDGVLVPDDDVLCQAAVLIRQAGGLFIADEVQAGFGRTGRPFWGFARHHLVPDLVTLGKPMGNGHPVAGVVGSRALFSAFGEHQRYFNTFGGNPVSCQAALAVLDIIEQDSLAENADVEGAWLRAELGLLAAKFPVIGEVRGAGLFTGVDLVVPGTPRLPDPLLASRAVNAMREAGVLISTTGPQGNVLKIRPPLIFQRQHGQMLLETLEHVLSRLL